MRVLIDAHMLGSRETGNETYVANLSVGLSAIPGIQCAAAVRPRLDYPLYFRESNVALLPLHQTSDIARLAYELPVLCRRWAAALLHVTYVSPFLTPCPTVVSVHDVSFRRYPEFFSHRDRLLFRTLLPLSLKRASAIITISEHAKQEILTQYPGYGNKIHVTPLAPSPYFRAITDRLPTESIRRQYAIEDRFILSVGNLQPRKNLLRLIEAFFLVHKRMKTVQLVIVGKAEWKASSVYALVRRLGLEHEVVFTGYLPDEDLNMLYNAASVFIYPSIYEGFGLPILEAMACGVPVITSKTSAMPEVAGNAAILINPFNANEIAEAILNLLNDSVFGTSLVREGFGRVREFSWHRTAQQTISIYRNVLNGEATRTSR